MRSVWSPPVFPRGPLPWPTRPVGFQSTTSPTLTVQVLGTVANGYQIINRADVGGKYQGTWQTAQATWLTIVRRLGPVPTLPQTGY